VLYPLENSRAAILILPRSYQLLRMWLVVFYLNQIGVHNNVFSSQKWRIRYPVKGGTLSSVKNGAWLRRFDDATGVAKTDILRGAMRTKR